MSSTDKGAGVAHRAGCIARAVLCAGVVALTLEGVVGCGSVSGGDATASGLPARASVTDALHAASADPRWVQQAALADYNGWLRAQNVDKLPSVSKADQELTPYIGRQARPRYVHVLRHALYVVEHRRYPPPPARLIVVRAGTWESTKIRDADASVRFVGYFMIDRGEEDPLQNSADQRFRLTLHYESGHWKMVSDRAKWLTPMGPLGPPHED